MADDPNIRPSGSFTIATEGIGSAAPISVATRGFLEPDLQVSDIIVGGSGDVTVQFNYPASGIINTGGSVPVTHVISGITYYFYPATGGLAMGGEAGFYVEEETNIGVFYPSGQVTLGGEAFVQGPIVHEASGGIAIGGAAAEEFERLLGDIRVDGEGNITIEMAYPADGGPVLGGTGNGTFKGGIERSGMGSPYGRRRREHYNPHHYVMHAHVRPMVLGGAAKYEFEPAMSVELEITLDRVVIPIVHAPIDAVVLIPDIPKLLDFSNFDDLTKLARSYVQSPSGGASLSGSASATFISRTPINDDDEVLAMLSNEEELMTLSYYEHRDNDDDELLLML